MKVVGRNQKGFSAIEAILILVLLGLLGSVGYFVYNAQKGIEKNFNDSASSSNSSLPASENKNDAASYLEIKELGVKFKLSDDIKDAYYFVNSQKYVYLSVHKFDGLKNFEDCTAKGTSGDGSGLAVMDVAKLGEDNGSPAGDVWTQKQLDDSGYVKIGDTYYGMVKRQQSYCYDTEAVPASDPNIALTEKVKQAFIDAIPTITKL